MKQTVLIIRWIFTADEDEELDGESCGIGRVFLEWDR